MDWLTHWLKRSQYGFAIWDPHNFKNLAFRPSWPIALFASRLLIYLWKMSTETTLKSNTQWLNEWEGLQWELMIVWMGGWVDCTVQRAWMSALQKVLWMSRWLRIWLIEGVAVLIGDVRGCWFVIFVRVSEWMSICVSMHVWLIYWIDWIAYITEFSNFRRPCVSDRPENIFM